MTSAGDDIDYKALAQFRRELRKFLAFSESAAAAAQLTGQQHQALLAIRGLAPANGIAIGELAEILLLRQHSVVELIDRLSAHDLVRRIPDPDDGRRVLVSLSATGEAKLRALSAVHAEELGAVAPALMEALRSFNRIRRSASEAEADVRQTKR